MKSKKFMKRAMGENSSYRPEQLKIYKLLRKSSPKDNIEMEYKISYKGKLIAVADIINHTERKIYRIMGESHDSKHARISDFDQAWDLLEMKYQVRDIWYWNNNTYWK